MRKLLMVLLLASTSVVACSGDDATVVDLEDTGSDETLADSTASETSDNDTGTPDDTGTPGDDTGTPSEGGADTGTPSEGGADTSPLPDTKVPDATPDTMVVPDSAADTRPDAIADTAADTIVVPDVAVVCGSVTCTLDAQCAAVGCGTCRMSGKCGM